MRGGEIRLAAWTIVFYSINMGNLSDHQCIGLLGIILDDSLSAARIRAQIVAKSEQDFVRLV